MLGASVPVMAKGCSPACTGARGAGRSRTRLASLATVTFNRRHFGFFALKALKLSLLSRSFWYLISSLWMSDVAKLVDDEPPPAGGPYLG